MKPKYQKNRKHDPFWESRDEWIKKRQEVMNLYLKGFREHQIISVTGFPETEVKRIIEDDNYTKELAAKVSRDAIPFIKQARGMSLELLNIELTNMLDEQYRRRFIKDVKDLMGLMTIVKEMSLLSRLEEDKSTENIAIATQTTERVQQLAMTDPVFTLPEPKKDEDVN